MKKKNGCKNNSRCCDSVLRVALEMCCGLAIYPTILILPLYVIGRGLFECTRGVLSSCMKDSSVEALLTENSKQIDGKDR